MRANAEMIANLDPYGPPLIADMDTGYGGPIIVARTISEYIRAGVAGAHLEDQVLTKRCGHLGGKKVVPRDEYFARLRAAKSARDALHSDFVLIARTDALQTLGYDECLARLKTARDLGFDVGLLEGFESKEQARACVKELAPWPVLLNMVENGVTPLITVDEAREMGFRIMIFSFATICPAYLAIKETLERLRDKGVVGTPKDLSPKTLFEVCGLKECMKIDLGLVSRLPHGFVTANSPSLGTTWAKRVCSQLGSNVRDATLDDYDANGKLGWQGQRECEFNPSVFPMDKSPGSTGDWTKAKCQASYGTEYNSFCQWGASSPCEETQSAPQRAEEYTNALDTGSETPGPSSIVSTTPEAMFSVAQDYAGAGFSFEESIPQNTDSVAPTTFVTNAASANNEAPSQSTSNADSPQLPPSTTVEDGTPVADYAKVPDGIAAAENGQSAGTSIAEQSAAAPSEARHLSLRANSSSPEDAVPSIFKELVGQYKTLQLLVLPRESGATFLEPESQVVAEPEAAKHYHTQENSVPEAVENNETTVSSKATFPIEPPQRTEPEPPAEPTKTALNEGSAAPETTPVPKEADLGTERQCSPGDYCRTRRDQY
ncbi:Isocitrate lyase/phosphorylmutase [Botryosphaeria dothidea]|uniref:Isocitrate lyase/phosphorylmutase n=1 Tax=Botryosphaeria dothidea TaxID=55169 RepID=A0A8H4N9G3_9PEZI|nr:Isocitrate lyase/phosphorylmutase [Botryosphaeria dothidea]